MSLTWKHYTAAFAIGVALAGGALFGYTQWSGPSLDGPLPTATVYKSPTCNCCAKWVDHLEQAGFTVTVKQESGAAVKQRFGVPRELASCHTATIGNYVVEGHVPAQDVKRLLAQQPEQTAGLAVPGMPIGSPGMERGNQVDPYNVVAFNDKGAVQGVFASYGQ
jgi:hypothetical protein